MSARIDGAWHARKINCACGYEAVWIAQEVGDKVTLREQPGSKCCRACVQRLATASLLCSRLTRRLVAPCRGCRPPRCC